MKQEVIVVTEDELAKVEESVKRALASGAFRIGLVVVARRRSRGEIIGSLRTVLKGNIFPSISLWIVQSQDEVERIRNLNLGELYE